MQVSLGGSALGIGKGLGLSLKHYGFEVGLRGFVWFNNMGPPSLQRALASAQASAIWMPP